MPTPPALARAIAGGRCLVTAGPRFLLAEHVAACLERPDPLWARLGPQDRDPGALLAALIHAAARHRPTFGRATVDLLRRRPGPVAGWLPAFERLAVELTATFDAGHTLAIEDVHHLDGHHPAIDLVALLVERLPPEVGCLLTAAAPLRDAPFAARLTHVGEAELRLDPDTTATVIAQANPRLRPHQVRAAAGLCEGQPLPVAVACASAHGLGTAVERARDGQGMLRLLAQAWIASHGPLALRALALTLRLSYLHTDLHTVVLGGELPALDPWVQPLGEGWLRIRAGLETVLRDTLPAWTLPDETGLHRAADHLAAQGAAEDALRLYVEIADMSCAAHVLEADADRFLDLGQWETFEEWIGCLDVKLTEHPRLLHHHGEILTARGEIDRARRCFAAATTGLSERGDAAGACQSLLAESFLAARQGEAAHAQAKALAAAAIAEAVESPRQHAWVNWQLGSLAAADGEFDDALDYFMRATDAAQRHGDERLLHFMEQAEQRTRRLQDLRDQREVHRQAYTQLEKALQEAVDGLEKSLAGPSDDLDAMLGAYGWGGAPLAVKVIEMAEPRPQGGAWERALRTLGLRREFLHRAAAVGGLLAGGMEAAGHRERLALALSSLPVLALPRRADLGPDEIAMVAHLLGPLRVNVADKPVEEWPSGRGRAVLKYLLLHRDPWPTREVLMDTFWPDADPEAARNNLNVALHGLRRALRAVVDVPLIVYDRGCYRLDARVRLWLDVEEFERHVAAGRRLEDVGESGAAVAEYEVAASLYRGDLLVDDPYEEWPMLPRERLRLAFLDTLDRLSRLYFTRARYASAAMLCQAILEHDCCREDAHRRLMRCYSRQGQPALALRQYRTCVQTLHEELDAGPAPETLALAERIRRGEPV